MEFNRFVDSIGQNFSTSELILVVDRLLQLLTRLIQFDTSINPSQNLYPSSGCRDFLADYGQKHGFEILKMNDYSDGNVQTFPLVLLKRGKKPGKTVLFLGHLDVVPVTDEEKKMWKVDPFSGKVIDGRLYGRGAADMKGGVAAFVSAFESFPVETGNLIIALSGDEEIGGFMTMPLIIDALKANDLMPDFVINAEPSNIPIIITQRRGATWLKFSFADKKSTVKGYRRTIEFHSRQGDGSKTLHSSAFVLGVDTHAMFTAAKFSVDKHIIHVHSSSTKTNSVPYVVRVDYVEADENGEDVEYSKSLTDVMNAMASLASIDWPILPSKFGISVNPNLIEYDDGTISIIFDIRAMLKDTTSHQTLKDEIANYLSRTGTKVSGEISDSIDPVNVPSNSPLVKIVAKVAEKNGYRIVTIGEKLGGASDTRYFTQLGIQGIELGPIGYNSHGIDEAVDIQSLEKLVAIFREVYSELANSS